MIINGQRYEAEPAVEAYVKDLQAMLREESEENCELKAENFTLKAENARLEEGYQKSVGVIAATDCVKCKKDAEPVKHGRWIVADDGVTRCSICYGASDYERSFCGDCGAKMDGGVENA